MLLTIAQASHAQTVVPDPALVESLGLTATEAGWRYRAPGEGDPKALTPEQSSKVDGFLKADAASHEALTAWCRARGVEPRSAVAALLDAPSPARDDSAAVKEAGEGQPAAAVRWSDDVGAEKKIGRVSAFAEVGRKTEGAMLGQAHGGGTFYTIGLSGRF